MAFSKTQLCSNGFIWTLKAIAALPEQTAIYGFATQNPKEADYYKDSPSVDPPGPSLPKVDAPWGLVRVRRSGSWGENSDSIRATARSFDDPSYPGSNGFRLVRTA
jgi:formylglycine-generating enzyme required for sulfatase activity